MVGVSPTRCARYVTLSGIEMAWYIDMSALIKLVSLERESRAIYEWVVATAPELVSSHLLRTELQRALQRNASAIDIDVADGLAAVDMLPATPALFEAAGTIAPAELRSPDALHLVTALDLGEDCEGIVTYDDQLADAARHHGLVVRALA
jgi:predicted nucleic acid-binding protein